MTKQLIEWPFGRSAIGFNTLFNDLQQTSNMSTYPPYNIWQVDDKTYRIEVALAGFTQKDLTITHEKNTLSITEIVGAPGWPNVLEHHQLRLAKNVGTIARDPYKTRGFTCPP